MMKISNIILSAGARWKEPLLKLLPYELLRRIKGRMIQKSFQNLMDAKIEPFSRDRFSDGINLIGNIKAETGLGQSCRLVAEELEASGIPYSIYQYEQLGRMKEGAYEVYNGKISDALPYNINLIHINPHELGLAFQQNQDKIWNGRYNIGFWLWELEEFPDEWVPCFQCVDEIWTPSEFISKALRKKTDKPVVTIPYHVEAQPGDYCREDFGLPQERFLFLMMYDKNSMTERKNPKAVIEAYKKAFRPGEDVGLVIKCGSCDEAELEMLRKWLNGYQNVYFVTETLSREKVNSLISLVDAVVSLHRAEGFGLVMAEAMLMGTPVIATNWSSNTEFMNEHVACMVGYEMIQMQRDYGVFRKGNWWADASVDEAAGYMKTLYENREFGQELAERARKHIQEVLSMEQAIERIRDRVSEIYRDEES